MTGKIYLLPNILSDGQTIEQSLPSEIAQIMAEVDGIIAESEKGALAYLKRFQLKNKPHNTPLSVLNEHTKRDEMDFILEPVLEGETWALISDAGLPVLADPGAVLVGLAQQKDIEVQAISGPCSITMALMLSGLTAQRFAFHGYLPKDPEERERKIRTLEKRSIEDNATQIFIEAPYRNTAILESLMDVLNTGTMLSVAVDLTAESQLVRTVPVWKWIEDETPNIHKRPAVFLIKGVGERRQKSRTEKPPTYRKSNHRR